MSAEDINPWVDLSPEVDEQPKAIDYDAEELVLATSPELTDVQKDEMFTDDDLRDLIGLR